MDISDSSDPLNFRAFAQAERPYQGDIDARMGRAVEARVAPPFYRRTLTLTPSDATRLELLQLGFKPDKVVAVNNGVEEMFIPGGTPATAPTLVCVGRLAPVKRQDRLIDQAVITKRRVPELQLVIVGDGPLRPVLEARIAHHAAGGWIHLAGRLSHEDLVALYQRAWLVTSASLAEGWGLTLTEAAACRIAKAGSSQRTPRANCGA